LSVSVESKGTAGFQTSAQLGPAALAVIITMGFLGLLTALMTGYLKAEDNQAMLLMLGALGVAFGQVINFWLGSTAESGRKTELMAQSPAK
jgi:membrane protein DedA with SNARE-associated domain